MHRLRRSAKGGLQSVADLIWPPRSLISGERQGLGGGLSADELAQLTFLEAGCRRCARPFEFDMGADVTCPACIAKAPNWDEARAAVIYDQGSRPLILNLKHGGHRDGLPLLSSWMARAGADLLARTDWLVPVPLHYTRLVRRGFNQAAWLAQGIGRQAGRPVSVDGLIRRRRTPPQGGKSVRQRRRNVAGAFVVRPDRCRQIEGHTITLVDDVMTTGATARACTRALKAAGAEKVNLLVLARVVRSEDMTI